MQLGKKQKLTVIKKVDFGVYLGEEADAQDKVLLPKRQVPEGVESGDEIEVFLYKDSKDRLIATTNEPKIQLGEVAVLKVAQVTKIGAFLDWGLEKDLFVPFKEQTVKLREGEECLVALYIDKSERLCGTMRLYHYLQKDTPYKKDDMVTGIIYERSDNFGVFVAVDGKYSALIPKKEAQGDFPIGKSIQARVTSVKEDGKMDLSVRQRAHIQIDDDAQNVLGVLDEFDGVLPFNDKASAEVIKREFGLSKNAFKRAVGRLLKEGKIEITEKNIKKIK